MFTTATRSSRLASFTFAVVMAVAVNGSLLMTFDSVATTACRSQSSEAGNVAVLETVTIVGHRI